MTSYIYSKWIKAPHGQPTEFYSELDGRRFETRKIEIYGKSKIGYASAKGATHGTRLGIEPVPSIEEIRSQPEFTVKEITKDEFDHKWKELVKA